MVETLGFEIFAKDNASSTTGRVGAAVKRAANEVEAAQIKVEKATLQSSAAIDKWGKDSLQARDAAIRLDKANLDLERSTEKLGAAQRVAGGQAVENAKHVRQSKQALSELNDESGRTGGRMKQLGGGVAKLYRSLGDMAIRTVAVVENLRMLGQVINEGVQQGLIEANAQVALGAEGFAKMSAEAAGLANRLGLTRGEFLNAAGQGAILAKNMGFGQETAIKFGTALPDLAQKLSLMSSNTRDASESADLLRSALAGEYDPLQTIGINISALIVQERALAIQQENNGQLSTQQANALAVLAIVQEQTASQSGVLTTEQGRQAIKVQETTAKWKEYWQALEQKVTPALVNGIDGLIKWNAAYTAALMHPGQATDIYDAIFTTNAEVSIGASAMKIYQNAVDGVKKSVNDATWTMKDYTDALDSNNNALLGARNAETDYWKSINNVNEALKTNGRTLDVQTVKGEANRDALDQQAKKSLEYLASIQAQGAPADKFNRELDATRKRLEDAYFAFSHDRAAARAYANQILAIPKMAVTNVQLYGLSNVLAGFDTLVNRIAWVNGHQVNIRVAAGAANVRESRASGGWIAGGPSRVDSVPAMLAPGEFVVNAYSAQRHRGLLETINSGRGYAAGGVVLPASRGSGNITVIVQNHGVIASQRESEEWLAKSVRSLKRQGVL